MFGLATGVGVVGVVGIVGGLGVLPLFFFLKYSMVNILIVYYSYNWLA